jgi:signal transduction histidine kinase
MLVIPLVLVIAVVTAASLLIVRSRLQQQIVSGLSADLERSMETFQSVESQRLSALRREDALLADLPSLKALMTTDDERTIDDASEEFWKVSGNDLFALADSSGRVMAARSPALQLDQSSRQEISAAIRHPGKHYLLSGGQLFEYSVQPLYFGDAAHGSLLGYVVSGFVIDRAFVHQLSLASGVEASFMSPNGRAGGVVTSTLPLAVADTLARVEGKRPPAAGPRAIYVNGEHFLALDRDISGAASAPLRLVVLKSFDKAQHAIRQINLLMLIAGALAIALGTTVMVLLSGLVTGPLEMLARGVRAYGAGQMMPTAPSGGTQEVRELNAAFITMRSNIEQAKQDLLEAERLATIGRMASSVSHDLRHYLAAIYANAEFLGTAPLSPQERVEIFADVRTAVHGTTDLLDSLLIFSQTGKAVRKTHALMATILESAVALVRKHPDAAGITITTDCGVAADTAAMVDERLLERAIYNLLLNACQSGRAPADGRRVKATIRSDEKWVTVQVIDNGPGVADSIRSSLFDPFVSEGKQKGTGLGLTLVASVAAEHGGTVTLASSRAGETVFHLAVPRAAAAKVTLGKELGQIAKP